MDGNECGHAYIPTVIAIWLNFCFAKFAWFSRNQLREFFAKFGSCAFPSPSSFFLHFLSRSALIVIDVAASSIFLSRSAFLPCPVWALFHEYCLALSSLALSFIVYLARFCRHFSLSLAFFFPLLSGWCLSRCACTKTIKESEDFTFRYGWKCPDTAEKVNKVWLD